MRRIVETELNYPEQTFDDIISVLQYFIKHGFSPTLYKML